MKRFLFLIITVISIQFFMGCSSQVSRTDKEKMNLKGNIESILTLSYEAIDKFGEGNFVKGNLSSFGNNLVVFDTVGNIVSDINYYIKDNSMEYLQEFDEKGYKKRFLIYEAGNIRFSSTYENDSKGVIISETDQDGVKFTYKREFNDKGKIIKEKTSKYSVETYKYDEKGNQIEWSSADDFDKTPRIRNYKYDSSNRLIREEVVGKHYWLYTYNNKNQPIEVKMFSLKNTDKEHLLGKTNTLFDKNNNESRKTIWNENGEIESITNNYYFYIDTLKMTRVELDKDNLITKVEDNLYQANNKKLSEKTYSIKSEIFSKNSFNYQKNKLISKIYSFDNSFENEVFTYDGNLLTESKFSEGGNTTITKYDKQGRSISITKFDKDNKTLKKTTFNYSGNETDGTMESTSVETKTNKEIKTSQQFKNGNLTESKQIENGIEEIMTFEYDKNNNVIKVTNSINNRITEFRYKFDKQGNWIEKTSIENNKPKEIRIRVIKYTE